MGVTIKPGSLINSSNPKRREIEATLENTNLSIRQIALKHKVNEGVVSGLAYRMYKRKEKGYER